MTPFIIAASLLVLGVLALVLLPVVRARRNQSDDARGHPVLAALRQQRREIEEDFARGGLTANERDTALTELVQRAGEELPADSQIVHSPRTTPTWLIAAAFALLVPALAIPIYLKLGSPAAINPAPKAPESAAPTHDLETAAAMLAKKLEQHPENGEGWVLLARSQYALGRFKEAVAAFEKASALLPPDASVLADYADALGMEQGRSLAGKPYALIKQALAADAHNKKALALAATAELDAHHADASLGYWRRLLADLPPDSDEAKQVSGIIDEIRSTASGKPTQPPIASAQPTNTSVDGISGTVSIALPLGAKTAPTDTVFIFARAVDGPRAPLAIMRVAAKDLPKAFTLDDSMGMGGAKLSLAQNVRIEARVSKSGGATPQPGDLSGASAPVKPGARDVKVVIDRVVQ
jgi:cytochrome c-type biogenesis protein CcmH